MSNFVFILAHNMSSLTYLGYPYIHILKLYLFMCLMPYTLSMSFKK